MCKLCAIESAGKGAPCAAGGAGGLSGMESAIGTEAGLLGFPLALSGKLAVLPTTDSMFLRSLSPLYLGMAFSRKERHIVRVMPCISSREKSMGTEPVTRPRTMLPWNWVHGGGTHYPVSGRKAQGALGDVAFNLLAFPSLFVTALIVSLLVGGEDWHIYDTPKGHSQPRLDSTNSQAD